MRLLIFLCTVIGIFANQEEKVEKNCIAEPAEGQCTGNDASYFFFPDENKCFKGCGQNGNSYATHEECIQACKEKRTDCPENSFFYECGSPCEKTCENYDADNVTCPPAKCIVKCICMTGYVKTKEGKCVLTRDCPDN